VTESEFQAFELVGALVVVLDPDGRIVYWNLPCSDLTAYSLEEVRGRRLWDFALVPDDAERFKAMFATLLTSQRSSAYANCWVTKAGEQRWIAWSHTLTKHPDGRVQYVIKTGIDRTEGHEVLETLRASGARFDARLAESGRLYQEARQVADDLREANQNMVGATIRAQELAETMEAALKISEDRERDLQAVAEFREMFLGIVGHDLRNPLGTIVMSAEALRHSGHLDERDQHDVSRIVANCGRMSRMILQLLDFTRARLGGGFPILSKPANLRDVCRNVVDEFGAAVHLEVLGDVTGTWDPDRLTEALSNVTGNAVEHARPGTVVLVRAHAGASEAVVEIVNQGEPIPPDVLAFIFEPFRQATRRRSTKGNLGLGLYIAKQIVVASGGTLDVRSGDGTTTFVMRLPRNARAVIPASPPADAHP